MNFKLLALLKGLAIGLIVSVVLISFFPSNAQGKATIDSAYTKYSQVSKHLYAIHDMDKY